MDFVRFGFKATAMVTLLIGLFVIWCGLSSSNAINDGALLTPSGCADSKFIADDRVGATTNRTALIALSRQINTYRNRDGMPSNLVWHFGGASATLGLVTFWSKDDRRTLSHEMIFKMRPCRRNSSLIS